MSPKYALSSQMAAQRGGRGKVEREVSFGEGKASHWSKSSRPTALEATQGEIDGFFSQLPYKCHLEEVGD